MSCPKLCCSTRYSYQSIITTWLCTRSLTSTELLRLLSPVTSIRFAFTPFNYLIITSTDTEIWPLITNVFFWKSSFFPYIIQNEDDNNRDFRSPSILMIMPNISILVWKMCPMCLSEVYEIDLIWVRSLIIFSFRIVNK